MKKSLFLFGIFAFCVFAVCGQSTSDEIQRLKNELKESQEMTRRAEADAKNKRYLAVANELAERAIEIQEKELSGLMAMQAYIFNERSGGYTYNHKIYNALIEALKKYDLVPKSGVDSKKYLLENVNNKPTFSAFFPNSQRSVVAEQNGNLRIVDEKGTMLRILMGHRAQVDQIQFSHSGKLIATSGKDNTIRIWNLTQINMRPLVITESDLISKLTFSPDDAQILYARGVKDVTICQLPLDMKLLAADFCSVLTRNLTKEEWNTYVGDDLEYENTCPRYFPNK